MKRSDTYKPMMSAARAERIRVWHEEALRGGRPEENVELAYLGREISVAPTVFSPTPVSPLLGNAVLADVRHGDRVLDMGTGSGVNAILAASKASDVVAVDVNPAALGCAKENAERNGVGSRVQVLESDLFEKVNGKFDLVIFDPPFRWFKPRDMRERGMADEGYKSLTTFFDQVKKYLEPDARILLFFGTSGDINYLRHLIREAGFKKKVLASQEIVKDGWKVKYYTYKLVQNPVP